MFATVEISPSESAASNPPDNEVFIGSLYSVELAECYVINPYGCSEVLLGASVVCLANTIKQRFPQCIITVQENV